MTISSFVKRDFQTIGAYAGTQSIKKKLIHYFALVVQDEEQNVMVCSHL